MHLRAQTLSRPTNDRVACRSAPKLGHVSYLILAFAPGKGLSLGQSNLRQYPPRQEQRAFKGLFGGCITPVRHKLFHALSFLLSILPTHSLFLNLPAVLLGIFHRLRFFSFFPSTTQLDVGGGLEGFLSFRFLRQTALSSVSATCAPFVFEVGQGSKILTKCGRRPSFSSFSQSSPSRRMRCISLMDRIIGLSFLRQEGQ